MQTLLSALVNREYPNVLLNASQNHLPIVPYVERLCRKRPDLMTPGTYPFLLPTHANFYSDFQCFPT